MYICIYIYIHNQYIIKIYHLHDISVVALCIEMGCVAQNRFGIHNPLVLSLLGAELTGTRDLS